MYSEAENLLIDSPPLVVSLSDLTQVCKMVLNYYIIY